MIPKNQLSSLKPIKDQVNRTKQVKSKRTLPIKRHWLTKRARQWALYPASSIKSDSLGRMAEPKGKKWYGQKPMKDRKKRND